LKSYEEKERGIVKGTMSATIQFEFAEGRKYVGQVQNGIPEGEGVMTWANGDKYEGEFDRSWLDGSGTLTCADGRVFVGEFLCDQPHKGKMTWPSGESYEGYFHDGKIDTRKRGTYIHKNGTPRWIETDGSLFNYLKLGEYNVTLPCANPDPTSAAEFIESYISENFEHEQENYYLNN